MRLLSYTAIPVGQLCVGPLADAFTVALAAGVVHAAVAVLPLASGAVRRLRHAVPSRRD
ncbi:hypothetical protein [Allokutzneria oryzae]